MDTKLRQDLNHFFNVYQNNVGDILRKRLPPAPSALIEKEIAEELDTFHTSVLNRLAEEQEMLPPWLY